MLITLQIGLYVLELRIGRVDGPSTSLTCAWRFGPFMFASLGCAWRFGPFTVWKGSLVGHGRRRSEA